MGIISTIMAGRGEITISQLDKMMTEAAYGVPTAAGVTVSEQSSLRLIPVFACVRLLANTIASLPFPVYRYTTGGGKRRDWEHPLYPILHDAPNQEMSAFDFWSAIVASLELWGNGYAEISRNYIGDVAALWPLDPACMKPDRWGEDGRLVYKYHVAGGPPKEFRSEDLLHIRGFGSNGITGYGPIALARRGIALADALEEYGARAVANDATPGGVLSVEGTLKDDGRARLKTAWKESHQGPANARDIAVLDAGAKFQPISIPNEDAQYIEQRKYQKTDIATLFGVPPHMIGDTERSTSWGTGIEAQTTGFMVMGLRARLVMIEQQVMLSLFSREERRTHKAEFVVDGLLRGDAATRHETYQKGIQNGYYCINDILRLENMNPIGPEGERRFVNGNMVPIDQAGMQVARQTPGARVEEIVREAAARIVRKEIAAMGKAAKRWEENEAAWRMEVLSFYATHTDFVAQTLRLERDDAYGYVEQQKDALMVHGPSCMDDWPYRRVDDLVKLALGGNDA
jgi:HK97 family phage portal protein